MIREELSRLKTGPADLRKFGLVVGGVFALLGAWWWWRGKSYYAYPLVPAVPLIVLGMVWPRGLKQVYLAWMSLALVMGLIVSTIFLTVFFYCILCPIGLLARLVGKDFLGLRLQKEAQSYWLMRTDPAPKVPSDYEQQF